MKSILSCLILLLLGLPAQALDLPLRAEAEVGGSQVLLRDLLSTADAVRLAQISGPIELFRAPEPGMTRTVSRQTLARLVGRRIAPGQLHLSGAERVSIRRQGVWIEKVEMEAVLHDFLAEAARQRPGIEFSFAELHLPPRFMVAPGRIEHQVIPSEPAVIGSRHLTLLTRVDGELVNNQTLRVKVVAKARVLVATADLRRGDQLSEANLLLQERDISRLDEPFFQFEPVLGKSLKRMVRSGQPLLRREVDFPPLIRRGDRVTIQLNTQGFLLSASGEARQNGELGETIRVRNSSSQREIRCRVDAAGLVSVEL